MASNPGTCKMFLFCTVSAPTWLLSGGAGGEGANLTTHLHPVTRSRMVELYLHSPHISSVPAKMASGGHEDQVDVTMFAAYVGSELGSPSARTHMG
jgi:hypothetical protein